MAELSNRSRGFRKRLLDLSQRSGALHLSPAFSCLELVDFVYGDLVPRFVNSDFIVSKGHGYLAQLIVLESLGIVPSHMLESIGTNGSLYGGHPDRGQPGIIASTGSLGHGLGLALGLSISKSLNLESLKSNKSNLTIVLVSDGELQEGSTWENLIVAPSLCVKNLVMIIDNNDMQTVGTMSVTHSNIYPLDEKLSNLGWQTATVDGHDLVNLNNVFNDLGDNFGCFALIAKTVKGKGVSFMESSSIWHYRSPNKDEYALALKELGF